MFAVTRHYKVCLPSSYWFHSWFRTDEHTVDSNPSTSYQPMDIDWADEKYQYSELSPSDEAPPTELRKRSTAKAIASQCRELLDSLRGFTCIITEYEKLQKLHQGIQAALVGCQRATTKDNELVLEQMQTQATIRYIY